MAYQLVTCPESADLEMIELAETPCGTLILGCSWFRPPCAVSCPRTCAAHLDRRVLDAEGGALDLDETLLSIGDDTSLDVLDRLRTRASTEKIWPEF